MFLIWTWPLKPPPNVPEPSKSLHMEIKSGLLIQSVCVIGSDEGGECFFCNEADISAVWEAVFAQMWPP